MKRIIAWVLLFSLLFAACGISNDPLVIDASSVVITDDLGREVTVGSPRRVAALLASFAQIWQLAGGQVVAAPEDAWVDLNLQLPEDAVNLGSMKSLSLELLLQAQPDLILASVNTRQHMEWKQTLESTEIPVLYFDVEDFEDYLRVLSIFTDLTGRKDLLEENGLNVQKQIASVVERSKQRLAQEEAPTVLCIVASASIIKAKNSEGNVLSSMLHTLGCRNIADADTILLDELSMEHILLSDPDYIFFVQRGDDAEGMREYVQDVFLDAPAWSTLSAVQNGRVFFMEKELFHLKPNHRWGDAYEILEEILQNG